MPHGLMVYQPCDNPHGDIHKKRRKTCHDNLFRFLKEPAYSYQPECVLLLEKVAAHNNEGNHIPYGCGKALAEQPHIQREGEEDVTEHIKNPAQIAATVKYSFSFLPPSLPFPRMLPNRTLPPMPNSSPRLNMTFQIGEMIARAAEPFGPS